MTWPLRGRRERRKYGALKHLRSPGFLAWTLDIPWQLGYNARMKNDEITSILPLLSVLCILMGGCVLGLGSLLFSCIFG